MTVNVVATATTAPMKKAITIITMKSAIVDAMAITTPTKKNITITAMVVHAAMTIMLMRSLQAGVRKPQATIPLKKLSIFSPPLTKVLRIAA